MTRTDIREAIDTWLNKRYRVQSTEDILSPMERAMIYRTADHAAEYGHWPSLKWLTADLGIEHRTTAARTAAKLKRAGILAFKKGKHPAMPCKISVPIFTVMTSHQLSLTEHVHENTDLSLPLPRPFKARSVTQDAGGNP